MSFSGIHHVVIRVNDLKQSVDHWQNALGMTKSRSQTNPDLGVEQAFFDLPQGGFIELIAPLSDDTPVAKALATRGEGVHLVSMSVDNVDKALAAYEEKGVAIVGAEKGPKFIHPKSANGVMIGVTDS